jgi:hypothetical protein
LTYYHPGSPIGEVFKALAATECPLHVGIVGLGAGTLAALLPDPVTTSSSMRFDPAVIAAAEGPHFSFVAAARERGAGSRWSRAMDDRHWQGGLAHHSIF